MSRLLLAAVALSLFMGTALAEPAGDAQEGRIKAYTCTGCHGVTGWTNAYPNYHVPKIGGQNYDYLVTALTGYKDGTRQHPTMQVQGESMTDQDIRDIAVYLSKITE